MARAYGERHGVEPWLIEGLIMDFEAEVVSDWRDLRGRQAVVAAILMGHVVLPVERGEVDGGE